MRRDLKLAGNHILFFFAMLAFSSVAFAQEGIPGQPEREAPIESNETPEVDKIVVSEESGKPQSVRETPVITPASGSANKPGKPAAKNDANAAKENADPLNFNFLYYVIQKFKSSDILD